MWSILRQAGLRRVAAEMGTLVLLFASLWAITVVGYVALR